MACESSDASGWGSVVLPEAARIAAKAGQTMPCDGHRGLIHSDRWGLRLASRRPLRKPPSPSELPWATRPPRRGPDRTGHKLPYTCRIGTRKRPLRRGPDRTGHHWRSIGDWRFEKRPSRRGSDRTGHRTSPLGAGDDQGQGGANRQASDAYVRGLIHQTLAAGGAGTRMRPAPKQKMHPIRGGERTRGAAFTARLIAPAGSRPRLD